MAFAPSKGAKSKGLFGSKGKRRPAPASEESTSPPPAPPASNTDIAVDENKRRADVSSDSYALLEDTHQCVRQIIAQYLDSFADVAPQPLSTFVKQSPTVTLVDSLEATLTVLVLQVYDTGLTVPDSYARQAPPSYADEDMPDAEKEEIFDEMDVNGDGVIDREEWACYHHTTTVRRPTTPTDSPPPSCCMLIHCRTVRWMHRHRPCHPAKTLISERQVYCCLR